MRKPQNKTQLPRKPDRAVSNDEGEFTATGGPWNAVDSRGALRKSHRCPISYVVHEDEANQREREAWIPRDFKERE
jgi:hypothetical protein